MKKIVLSLSLTLASFSFANTIEPKINEKITILNKYGYGYTQKSLDKFNGLSKEDWFKRQVKEPNFYEDDFINKRYKFFNTNDEFLATYKKLYLDNKNNLLDMNILYGENGIVNQTINKRIDFAIHSENRIREMMQWFWFNHFNIGVYSSATSVLLANSYEDMIRKQSLGNFKDLLRNITLSPAMMAYLNNVENRYSKINPELNENQARELLELHTLGVDGGYTQKDVTEVSRILSGFTALLFRECNNKCNFDNITSYDNYMKEILKNWENKNELYIKDYFMFNGLYHDYGDKLVLGKKIKGEGFLEIEDLLDLIVKNPSTAKHISKKLAVYFMNDKPSEKLINSMAKTFLDTNGEISDTLLTLFNSKEFEKSLNKKEKYKDAYTYIISTYKTGLNYETLDYDSIKNISLILTNIEANPYSKDTPNGFSIYGKDWINSGRLQQYISIVNSLMENKSIIYSNRNTKKYEINKNLFEKINLKTEKEISDYLMSEDWLKR